MQDATEAKRRELPKLPATNEVFTEERSFKVGLKKCFISPPRERKRILLAIALVGAKV